MDRPEKDDIALWQSNHVTKFFIHRVKENLEDIKDGWANGDFINEDALTTVQSNSNAQGTAHALIALIAEMEGLADD